MPATEQTWRNQVRLHLVFGATGFLLLLCTLWMFAADHDRSWKYYQKKNRSAELTLTDWRKEQFQTDEYQRELRQLQASLAEAMGQGFDKEQVQAFKSEIVRARDDIFGSGPPSFASLDSELANLDEAAKKADTARRAFLNVELKIDLAKTGLEDAKKRQAKAQEDLQKAEAALTAAPAEKKAEAEAAVSKARAAADDEAAAVADFTRQQTEAQQSLAQARSAKQAAETEVATPRERVLRLFDKYIKDAKFEEDKLSQERKFAGAIYDRERAKLDLAIRDNKPTDEQQEKVDAQSAELQRLTLEVQKRKTHRLNLEKTRGDLTKQQTEAEKKLKDHLAEQERLEKSKEDRRSEFFTNFLPGKKWLELPILDAFNSPLKIDNLWSDELEWNINFRTTRRYDRCTTCHQNMLKTLPGSSVEPAFAHEQVFVFTLAPRDVAAEESSATSSGSDDATGERSESAEAHYGLRIADKGLLNRYDVTISFVEPYSLAAQAEPLNEGQLALLPAETLRQLALKPVPLGQAENIRAGLIVGDVIESIAGDRVRSPEEAKFRLQEAARDNASVELTIRRGLPHPYATHPRLDLYLGSMSPHKLADFACSICHEGQGSATEFKWASHTPDSPLQREEWSEEHGWFDNHHWIYPMYAKRFVQSTCLKCHHDVTELEESDRFPEPPAPKLLHGYQLILKYGCFGCHEINGFDGPKKIGPDLRLEPNFFAAAQRLKADAAFEKLSDDEKDWVEELIAHPERDDLRHRLYDMLLADVDAEQPRFDASLPAVMAPMFKDIESPGKQRKVGPSLRFVKHKLDPAFLYDWIREPKHFRSETRMPQFFGLHDHLSNTSKQVSEQYEPIEILGAVRYLLDRSQKFDYLPPAEDISEATRDEKVERGKVAFQQRGCLACHSHRDFPDVALYRPAEKIQQAPDLSNVGDKFDPQRNPQGRQWLYSWISQPTRYHVRTVMPNTILQPIEQVDAEGNVVSRTDPVDDIVEYLMASRSDWEPAPGTLTELDEASRAALNKLSLEYLGEVFAFRAADDYLKRGIPSTRAGELKGAEIELVVPQEQYEASQALSDDQKLVYIGRRTIAKYGCYGCHDIPGFEDAKPIGTGLADWGRKDPARLAFEHIAEYLSEGHGHAGDHAEAHNESAEAREPDAASEGAADESAAESAETTESDEGADAASELEARESEANETEEGASTESESDAESSTAKDELPPFYDQQLHSGNRIGFIYQKLRAPRSYDFKKTENKKYNERLRMPQFHFSVEEREAVITFVLGLVGEPPKLKYVFKPNARAKALLEGRQVLEKYNCGGCHVLEGERWEISYRPGQYGEQQRNTTYPFLLYQPSLEDRTKSTNTDFRNLRHAVIEGLPSLGNDGLPVVNDPEGEPVLEEDSYSIRSVEFSLYPFKPMVLDGFDYQVNERGLAIRGAQVERRYPARGGDLTKYLLPHVVAREQAALPTLKGAEAWGWLPPPLINEGIKVQTDWLHSFLLDPFPIRPGVVLRMPKFNMSPQEATALVNYFAARDSAAYPYSYSSRQRVEHLQQAETEYRDKLPTDQAAVEGSRLDLALNIVTNPNYCVQCHIVGDFVPTKEERGKGPNLSQIYKRLRPEYARNYIAQPTVYLPYTGMPVNIKYDPALEHTGSLVPQEVFPGDSTDQLEGLVDLLMNYDEYSAELNPITPKVKEQQQRFPLEPQGEEPATDDQAAGSATAPDSANATAPNEVANDGGQ